MPGRRSLCGCLGGKRRSTPQISYGVENGGLTLKPVEVQEPIPDDEDELNALFEQLVVSTYSYAMYSYSCQQLYVRTLRTTSLITTLKPPAV